MYEVDTTFWFDGEKCNGRFGPFAERKQAELLAAALACQSYAPNGVTLTAKISSLGPEPHWHGRDPRMTREQLFRRAILDMRQSAHSCHALLVLLRVERGEVDDAMLDDLEGGYESLGITLDGLEKHCSVSSSPSVPSSH